MGTRPLRQHYDAVTIAVAPDLGTPVGELHRHRARFLAHLAALDPEHWCASTRCTEWDVADVVAHLTTADRFWIFTIETARAGHAPGRSLEGFDPSTSLEPFVAGLRGMAPADLLVEFAASSAAIETLADALGPEDWVAAGESPLGHLPARFLLTHLVWDSWMHERDIFVPLAGDPEVDELMVLAWWTLLIGGLQGGLLDDPAPVGPGLDTAVDRTLAFSDIPGFALRVRLDHGIAIDRAAPTEADAVVSAVDLAEHFAGRDAPAPTLPPDLAAHLTRAAAIL